MKREREGLPVDESVDPATALNGAQVTALVGVVQAVASGAMPRDAGVQIIHVAFPLNFAQAEAVMGTVGKGFVPTTVPRDLTPLGAMNAAGAATPEDSANPGNTKSKPGEKDSTKSPEPGGTEGNSAGVLPGAQNVRTGNEGAGE